MINVNNILVPIDFSESSANAFQYAAWFADKYEANIQLLHVVYPATESIELPSMSAKITQDRVNLAREKLQPFIQRNIQLVNVKNQLQQLPKVSATLEIGYPTSYIPEFAKANKIDLIIMGTKGERNAVEKILGSVTSATIARAACPVLAVPNDTDFQQIHSVTYASDLAVGDPFHIWEMTKFLQPFDPVFRVIHVQADEKERKPISMDDIRTFFEDQPELKVSCHKVEKRDVLEELDEFVENWSSNLLIMYKPKRKILDRLFHKSLTKQVALNTDVPLLVLQ